MTMTAEKSGFRFREWDIYIDSRIFRKRIIVLLKNFPPEEKYALTIQARRALNSIILNIAEGANRFTDKDTRVFINRAHTSLDEVVACMDCALDDSHITQVQHNEIIDFSNSLAKRFRKFFNHLSSS